MSQADQLEERLIEFAARIIQLSAELPKTSAGRHISLHRHGRRSKLRGSARRRESADFLHKLGVVQKELNETSVWLRLISKIVLPKPDLFVAIFRKTQNSPE
jgi:four helix bundle protein